MVDAELIARVRGILADVLQRSPQQITDDTAIETCDTWDSLSHVSVIMAIEQEFATRINIDDATRMTSFPAICRLLAARLSSVSAR